MSVFLLVHGAWHGAWCWGRVAPLLQRRGHRAVAIDLPAHGDDRMAPEDATLDAYAARICAALESESEPVVLAGHSMGGIAISAAAERCPERVRVLVYLAAFLLPDGRTLVDTFAADAASLLRPGIVRGAVRGTSLVTAEAARAGIYSDASAEDAAWATARLGPDPNRPAATPLQLSEARYGAVPRVYIECLRDRAVTLPLQRAMVAASPCRRVISLDCGHSPMFSAPALLAAALEQAAEV